MVLLTLLMLGMGMVFWIFPRSTYSALERRELQSPPAFTLSALLSGEYAAALSGWFSDSEPFRDVFLSLSMRIKAAQAIGAGDEQVAFHSASAASAAAEPDVEEADVPAVAVASVEENAVVTNSGVIVVGQAPTVRALMAFSGKEKGARAYARVMNAYAHALGAGVRVYCMPVPTAVEFYCPEKARSLTVAERPVLDHLFQNLDSLVTPVDIYATMQSHVAEPVYLRTDHHWAPLGAYYAACQFAQTAGVTVPQLQDFDPQTVTGYVGSMFGYSQDHAVKESPEDFVYYVPRTSYHTHYTVFEIDADYHIVGEGVERDGPFFVPQPAGSSDAYSTFMGSDKRITQVTTQVSNHRHLLIVKDSFGNAVPGYLFGSFAQVHVIDFRYFPYSIKEYVRQHGITDLLFVNNLSHACSGGAARNYREWLEE